MSHLTKWFNKAQVKWKKILIIHESMFRLDDLEAFTQTRHRLKTVLIDRVLVFHLNIIVIFLQYRYRSLFPHCSVKYEQHHFLKPKILTHCWLVAAAEAEQFYLHVDSVELLVCVSSCDAYRHHIMWAEQVKPAQKHLRRSSGLTRTISLLKYSK